MDLAVIKAIFVEVGVPVAGCIVFAYIVVGTWRWAIDKADAALEKQANILEKLCSTAEASSHATDVISGVLDKLCTVVTHIELMAVEEMARVKAREDIINGTPH